MNTFILKNSIKIKSPNFIYNSWIKNTTSIPFLNSSKAIIILPGTKPFIPDSETCVLKIIKKFFFFFILFHILDFYDFFLEIFYSTWDIKLYIEVTKNYNMVTIKKKVFYLIFLSRFTYKKPQKMYIYSYFTRAKPTPALTTTGKKTVIVFHRVESSH